MEATFKNYRCFRDATLRLSPLTVLVGATACGKSTIARALDPHLELGPLDVWQGRNELRAEVRIDYDNDSSLLSSLLPTQKAATKNWLVFRHPTPEFLSFSLNPAKLRGENLGDRATRLSEDGSNLTSVIEALPRATQGELSRQFCSLVPVYSAVETFSSQLGRVTLRFQDRRDSGQWYTPDEASNGSLLTLALLVILHQTPPVDILVIENPEHGLHPFLLLEVIGLLRKLATGELTGRKMRVVLTTHSATVLDFVRPDELRLLSRDQGGSVKIAEIPMHEENRNRALEINDESLGQAWLAGGLGGTQ